MRRVHTHVSCCRSFSVVRCDYPQDEKYVQDPPQPRHTYKKKKQKRCPKSTTSFSFPKLSNCKLFIISSKRACILSKLRQQMLPRRSFLAETEKKCVSPPSHLSNTKALHLRLEKAFSYSKMSLNCALLASHSAFRGVLPTVLHGSVFTGTNLLSFRDADAYISTQLRFSQGQTLINAFLGTSTTYVEGS